MQDMTDTECAVVFPADDGIPHKKACPECAFRRHDPQQIGDAYQRRLRAHDGRSAFYCIHRGDKDHRICACYAAINRIKTHKI